MEKWKRDVFYDGEVILNSDPTGKELTINDLDRVINSLEYFKIKKDLNGDGLEDGFIFFNNPTHGNWYDSDLGLLIYSKNGKYIDNKNLTNEIKNKLEKILPEKFGVILDDYIQIWYNKKSNQIKGEWAIKQSLEGTFMYNVESENIECTINEKSRN